MYEQLENPMVIDSLWHDTQPCFDHYDDASDVDILAFLWDQERIGELLDCYLGVSAVDEDSAENLWSGLNEFYQEHIFKRWKRLYGKEIRSDFNAWWDSTHMLVEA